MKKLCCSMLAMGLFIWTGCSQKTMELDIQPGDTAPDFTLLDQTGAATSLDSLVAGQQPYVAIVFYRSADW